MTHTDFQTHEAQWMQDGTSNRNSHLNTSKQTAEQLEKDLRNRKRRQITLQKRDNYPDS